MIKSILICTDGSDHGNVASDYAIYLAKRMNARLMGLHVLDSRMLEGPLLSDLSGWVGAEPFGMQLEQFRELMEKKGEAVTNALLDRCEQQGIEIEVETKMGHPTTVILEEEARGELVVLGQKGEDAETIGHMMGSTVDQVSRHSAKPCLITPEHFAPVSRILAAYDGSVHASQAIHEASELAVALKVELVIVAVADGIDAEEAQKIAAQGAKIAQDHECRATTQVTKGHAAKAIMEMATQMNCDLIVVGAYGHSRIREMILGSVTAHLIAKSKIPVLLVR